MAEKKFDLSDFYIVDFVKNLGHRKNIFAVIYLVLNVLLITFLLNLFEPNLWLCVLYGLLIYGVSATLALSPLGERIFRMLIGCKRIEDPAILSRMQTLFEEVKHCAKTRHADFKINDGISLYICDDDDINAFAMGRRTLCVTWGLLNLSDDQIKGVLGHEFGHLATHDTDLILLITVGNFIISSIVTVIRLILAFYNMVLKIIANVFGDIGVIFDLMRALYWLIYTVCINGLMWLWTQLGILLVMKSSREAEYEADAFACDLGYSEGLLSFFQVLQSCRSSTKDNSIFAALSDSHPSTDMRIARIETRPVGAIEG